MAWYSIQKHSVFQLKFSNKEMKNHRSLGSKTQNATTKFD